MPAERPASPQGLPPFRTGLGYDVHRLAAGRPCILGGVRIPHHQGPEGHSDADVLLHALCDALLGAANLRDIGYHFPNTDPQWKGADSLKLLAASYELVQAAGWQLVNADCTLVAEAPKINPHVPAMQQAIAGAMQVQEAQVSIKATTNEKLGFLGREEGISALASVLVYAPAPTSGSV